MTTNEYIALTRATGRLIHMGSSGVVEIDASDIPAVLNCVTNGAFRFHWSCFILSRTHIEFEKLDKDHKFAEMQTMLASDDELDTFLRWHMMMTADVWTWNFPCGDAS
jgi:hypothetical protein